MLILNTIGFIIYGCSFLACVFILLLLRLLLFFRIISISLSVPTTFFSLTSLFFLTLVLFSHSSHFPYHRLYFSRSAEFAPIFLNHKIEVKNALIRSGWIHCIKEGNPQDNRSTMKYKHLKEKKTKCTHRHTHTHTYTLTERYPKQQRLTDIG